MVSSLGTWAEEERESKSLRGVFPFSHVQQQNIALSSHSNHNSNHRNPIASHVHNLNNENRNSHSNTHHQPDVFHTHQESQSDGYYVSKVNGANVKSSSEFPTTSNSDHIHDAHHESGNDEYYISKVDGVSTKVSPEFQSRHIVDPYQSENTDSVKAIPNRESRQGGGERDGFGEDIFIDLGAVAAAGERCIDKVVIVEETRYDDVIECKHSYTEKCHTTYVTDFKPQQEEVCEENFVKNCFIEYKNIASEDTVKFCHTPLECVGEGPEECKTVYESECQTNYHEHDVEDDIVNCETIQEEKCEDVTQGYSTERKCTKWPVQKCNGIEKKKVKKYSPETNCRKVPRQLCGPSGCELSPGPEFCFDKLETVIQEVREHPKTIISFGFDVYIDVLI